MPKNGLEPRLGNGGGRTRWGSIQHPDGADSARSLAPGGVGRGGVWIEKRLERWTEVFGGQLKGLVFFPRAVEGS